MTTGACGRQGFRFKVLAVIAALAVSATVGVFGHADAQAKAPRAATGPFSYDPAQAGQSAFLDGAGGPDQAGFQICAPGGGTIFPSGGTSATAAIRVFGIEQVADADGQPLSEPVAIPLDSALGMQLAGAFVIDPASYEFLPGICEDIDITIHNPQVDPAGYGNYLVTIKSQAPGSGIEVGSGTRYLLVLRGASETDDIEPIVTIDAPANGSTQTLGSFRSRSGPTTQRLARASSP